MPIWFLVFLVLLKSLLLDPNFDPIVTEPADTPIGLDFAINQLNGKNSTDCCTSYTTFCLIRYLYVIMFNCQRNWQKTHHTRYTSFQIHRKPVALLTLCKNTGPRRLVGHFLDKDRSCRWVLFFSKRRRSWWQPTQMIRWRFQSSWL